MKIIFMGTPDFAVPCLDILINNGYQIAGVVTQPDRPAGRNQSKLKPPPVKAAAERHGIKAILQPVKVRTPEFAASLRELAPDLIVTAAYGRILTREVLEVPPLGCINVHASLLPKYRGASPIQYALINGDSVTGITTMYMDEGLDTGDILMQEKTEITPDMNCQELYDRLRELGAETLLKTLKGLENGTLKRTAQDSSKAVTVPIIKKEMGLIDWNKSAGQIHNLIRGTNPWPGAYTYYKGSRLKVWKSAVLEACPVRPDEAALHDRAGRVRPGTIMKITGDNLIAATGNGCLRIYELQLESCRRMGVCECGHNMDEGEVLG